MKFSLTSQRDPAKGLDSVVAQLNKVNYFGHDDIADDKRQTTTTVSTGAATHSIYNLIASTKFGPFCFCNFVCTGNVTVNVLSFYVAVPFAPKLRRGENNFQTLVFPMDFAIVGGALSNTPAHAILSIPSGSDTARFEINAPNYGFWGPGTYAFAGCVVYPVESTV